MRSEQTSREAASEVVRAAMEVEVAAQLRSRLPDVAEQTVVAVISEVPGYAGAFDGEMRESIERAVEMALAGFLRIAATARHAEPVQGSLDGAYELGRGEARSGRTADALLAAYRVGARTAWREFSSVMVAEDMAAGRVAEFAELVFAYIDELSAASVAGHEDERATTGRVRELYLERLGRLLLEGGPDDKLVEAAERAGWEPPETLVAVLVPESQVRSLLGKLDPLTLRVSGVGSGEDDVAALLVPDADGARRTRLLDALADRAAVVGPARPWASVSASADRARRARDSIAIEAGAPLDTEQHLASLLIQSDPEARRDLRAQALQPLSQLRPATAGRLEATLRSWLLHQGRRDEVAAELFVHPQTVRYRMAQLRDLFGDRLRDPAAVLDIVVALGAAADPLEPGPEASERPGGSASASRTSS